MVLAMLLHDVASKLTPPSDRTPCTRKDLLPAKLTGPDAAANNGDEDDANTDDATIVIRKGKKAAQKAVLRTATSTLIV
jgi:hypothetical protein